MNEILDAFSQAGIQPPPSVELDGELHRFQHDSSDKKKSAWYIGFNNVANSGGTFVVMEFGSWKTGETHKYQSNGVKLDKHDKARVQDQIKKSKEKYERQKIARQREAADEAATEWASAEATFIDNKYFQAKRIATGQYGVRFCRGIGGTRILVPMRDIDDNLWGIQTIYEDGSKFFMAGSRVEASFHTIGPSVKDAKEIYICEGFATGVTIYEATKKTVVVAFNASNLVAVSKALFERHPDRGYVVCGDDDRWAEDGKNPGRDKAIQAAEACVGKTVFPKFQNVDGKPTDFNDLYVQAGLDEVKNQILGVAAEPHYIICLGYNEKKYYVYSNVNLQVQEFSPSELGTQMGLSRIQPTEYWESLYPGDRGGTRWGDAGSDIMQKCHDVGIFKADSIRGPGAWTDQGRPLFHCGDKIFMNGKYFDLNKSFKSKFMYEYSEKTAQMDADPLTNEEAAAFVEALGHASWKKEESGSILAAWMALAPISGALDWRPHLWLTGPAGTGKSWLMEHVCNKILHGYATFAQGQTTEAGLRQNQRSSSLPIIFDEFETNDEHSSQRVRMILELARQASSDSSAVVFKGTSSGDPLQFRPRFSMLVSSVRVNLIHEEDASRFTLLELERKNNSETFALLEDWAIRNSSSEFGKRLARRSFEFLPSIIKNARMFQKVIGKKYSMRFGQQWGTLAAGITSLIDGGQIYDEATATAWIESQFVSRGVFDQGAPSVEDYDETKCLDHLLHSFVEIIDFKGDRVKMPVLEIIGKLKDSSGYAEQLERIGIKAEEGFVYVIQNFEPIKKIYQNQKWAGGYAKALARIPGSMYGHVTRFKVFNKTYRCVKIPIKMD